MAKKEKKIDVYINNAPEFAQPILNHLRQLVHKACPDADETIKWGVPHFEYKGLLCGMASFKNHCAFTFHKASLMKDPHKIFSQIGKTAMGHLGQLQQIADLPNDQILLEYISEAKNLNEKGIKVKSGVNAEEQKKLEVPDFLLEALQGHEAARETFERFSYSHKKEYIEWITEAKREETRKKRLATMLEWLAEGKRRNWKYE